jgi:hypothetical protein
VVGHASELGAIVSGGQTGVDRAALELARRTRTPLAGWCPAGGWAEDLPEPPGLLALFPELRETPSADPRQRTEWNVRDSDATLVLVRGGVVSPGTDDTVAVLRDQQRPYLVADVDDFVAVRAWLAGLPAGAVLNVAGPRESEVPGIQRRASALLDAVLGATPRVD